MPNFQQTLIYGLLLCLLVFQLLVGEFGPARILMYACGAGFMVIWFIFSQKIVIQKELLYYGAFATWSFLGVWINQGDFDAYLIHLKTMMLIFGLTSFISFTLCGETDLKGLSIILILYFGFAYGGDFLGFEVEETNRLKGITSNPNVLGFICIYGLLATVYTFTSTEVISLNGGRRFWWLPFLIFAIAVLPTGSRKSIFSILALFFLQVLLRSKTGVSTVIVLVFIAFPSMLIFYDVVLNLFSETTMGERILDADYFLEGLYYRINLSSQAFEVFWENPIFGVGLNNFRLHSESGLEAHSYYFEILASTGFIGFSLLFMAYYTCFKKAHQIWKQAPWNEEAIWTLSFIFGTVLMGLGYSYHRSVNHWIIFSVLLTVIQNQHNLMFKNNGKLAGMLEEPT